jgi:hypothetical protein
MQTWSLSLTLIKHTSLCLSLRHIGWWSHLTGVVVWVVERVVGGRDTHVVLYSGACSRVHHECCTCPTRIPPISQTHVAVPTCGGLPLETSRVYRVALGKANQRHGWVAWVQQRALPAPPALPIGGLLKYLLGPPLSSGSAVVACPCDWTGTATLQMDAQGSTHTASPNAELTCSTDGAHQGLPAHIPAAPPPATSLVVVRDCRVASAAHAGEARAPYCEAPSARARVYHRALCATRHLVRLSMHLTALVKDSRSSECSRTASWEG